MAWRAATIGNRLRVLATALYQTGSAPRELRWLIALLAAAMAMLGFWVVAGKMAEGDSRGFDRFLLLALRDPADLTDPIGPRWLEEVARDFTALGGNALITVVTVGVAAYLLLAGMRSVALLVLVAVGGGTALSTLLKFSFARPRPDLVPHGVDVYLASFPSGHSMLAAVTYLTIGAILARVQPRWSLRLYILSLALLITLLVGVSRVYLGVHWPTDVLAGWCGGAAWALLCWSAALWLQRHGQVPSGTAPTCHAAGPASLPVRD